MSAGAHRTYLVRAKFQGLSPKNGVGIGLSRNLTRIVSLNRPVRFHNQFELPRDGFGEVQLYLQHPPAKTHHTTNTVCLIVRGWPFGRSILDEKRVGTRGGAPQSFD